MDKINWMKLFTIWKKIEKNNNKKKGLVRSWCSKTHSTLEKKSNKFISIVNPFTYQKKKNRILRDFKPVSDRLSYFRLRYLRQNGSDDNDWNVVGRCALHKRISSVFWANFWQLRNGRQWNAIRREREMKRGSITKRNIKTMIFLFTNIKIFFWVHV